MEELDKWYWIRFGLTLIFIISILSGNAPFKFVASIVLGGYCILQAGYLLFRRFKDK